MDIFGILTLFGGLALFLFGMEIMGDALKKQAGGGLKQLLGRLTSNPLKGFALGLLVTAVIQSSSATTVMVVGFVNSGIMELSQAIGIIMGANVGTTVTSWILSLSGLQGNSIWIRLLKPSSFSPFLALIGIILYMASKSEKKKNTGVILLGFSVLMTGMQTMSAAVEPLADIPSFQNLFLLFQNPILGLLAGALLTGMIQSSSASIGILQALAVTGAVTYGNAIPIIMGQNIGTCVTALLSSVGSSKNARRAALVHLYFNVIGSVAFMIIFYACNAIFSFTFLGDTLDAVGIAIIHTIFNLITTAILLPFHKVLEKMAYLTIPETESADPVETLDERLLSTPAIAVERSKSLALTMANASRTALSDAIRLMRHWEESLAQNIIDVESKIDHYEDQLGTYLVKLSSRDMTLADSHAVNTLLYAINDLERIADHAVNITFTARTMQNKRLSFSQEAQEELDVLETALGDILNRTESAFANMDSGAAASVQPLKSVIDELVTEIKSRHMERLQRGDCSVETGVALSDLLTDLQRVAGHCANIAVAIIQVQQDSFDRHAYKSNAKQNSENFMQRYQKYRLRYGLPAEETAANS